MDLENLPDEAKRVLALFPEFRLIEFNDSGANGYVMTGRHDVLQKDVAIKIYFHAENDVYGEFVVKQFKDQILLEKLNSLIFPCY